MRLLLDTHIALWATLRSPSLPKTAHSLIADADNDIVVSVVTVWEIAIKHPLARGVPDDMPISGHAAQAIFEEAGYTLLPITAAHAAAVETLPPLHGDPFDRMLIAQARTEQMSLLTADRRLTAYGAPVILA